MGQKIKPKHNLDGLINCLPPTQSFVTSPKIYAHKLCSIYKILWHPDSFVYWERIFGLAGRRAGASFFALHRDYLIVTRNFSAIYLDLVPFSSFTVTRSSLPFSGPDSYRDGKKQVTTTSRRSVAGSLPLIKPPGR